MKRISVWLLMILMLLTSSLPMALATDSKPVVAIFETDESVSMSLTERGLQSRVITGLSEANLEGTDMILIQGDHVDTIKSDITQIGQLKAAVKSGKVVLVANAPNTSLNAELGIPLEIEDKNVVLGAKTFARAYFDNSNDIVLNQLVLPEGVQGKALAQAIAKFADRTFKDKTNPKPIPNKPNYVVSNSTGEVQDIGIMATATWVKVGLTVNNYSFNNPYGDLNQNLYFYSLSDDGTNLQDYYGVHVRDETVAGKLEYNSYWQVKYLNDVNTLYSGETLETYAPNSDNNETAQSINVGSSFGSDGAGSTFSAGWTTNTKDVAVANQSNTGQLRASWQLTYQFNSIAAQNSFFFEPGFVYTVGQGYTGGFHNQATMTVQTSTGDSIQSNVIYYGYYISSSNWTKHKM